MGKGNETTTKFKVDISELKSAMQTARREVALANSEFKAVSSGMDDWKKSTDGLEAKLNQLKANLKSQEAVLSEYERVLAEVKAEYGENSKEAMEYETKLNNQRAVVNKTQVEINKYSNELKELKAQASQTGLELDELGDSARESGNEAEDGADGFTILKGALADLVADGIRATIEALQDLATDGAAAYSQFQAATGKTADEMDKWKDVIQQIYADNFGDGYEDIAQKITKINEVMGEMSPDELVKVTEAAMTLEDTFGMDMTETLRGAQNLMTHFGMTSEEAFDYLTQGAQNGLNYTDELGDNIAEYSGKFAEAGYSAEEYFQLLENGADGGAYNLDKVNDAINEVTTRIGDGTIEDSLDMFSQGTQDVFKAWQDGKATQKDVIDSIVGDINNAKSEQDKMNLSAKAFGTMAEDGGTKFISSLTSVGEAYDDVTGKAKELQDVKYSDVGSALSGLGRTLKTEILQPIADTIAPLVTDFINFLIDNMSVVAPIVTGVAVAFGILAGALAIQSLINGVAKAFAFLNTTLLANPIVLIVAGIVGLIAAIVMLWKKNETFRDFVTNAFETIKNAFTTVVDAVKTGIEKIKNFFTSIIDFIKNNWGSILAFLINPFAGLFKYFYDNNKKFREFVDNAVNTIKELPSKVGEWLTKTIGKVGSFASSLANKGKQAGSKLLNSVVNNVKKLPSKIKSIGSDVVAGLWTGMSDKVAWLKGKIKEFVGDVKSWLKKFFKIGSPSRLMAEEIGQWIPAGIGVGIEDNMDSLYGAMKTMGSMALGGLSSGADSVTGNSAIGGVVNNFNQTINSPKQLSRLEIYRQSKNLLGYAGGVR